MHCIVSVYALSLNAEEFWVMITDPDEEFGFHQNLITFIQGISGSQNFTKIHL